MDKSNPIITKHQDLNNPLNKVSTENNFIPTCEEDNDRVISVSQQAEASWDNKEGNIEDIENSFLFELNSKNEEEYKI